MEAMFYCATVRVTLQDIARIATEFGRHVTWDPSGDALSIVLSDRDAVRWSPLDEGDLADFSDEDRAWIAIAAPAAIYMIEHRYSAYPQLRYILHRLLELHGGIILCDDGDNGHVLTAGTIIDLHYPRAYRDYVRKEHLAL